jgi:hypothetical protein
MRSWLAGVSFAYALGCAIGLAQSPDSAAMKERLHAVAQWDARTMSSWARCSSPWATRSKGAGVR